MMTERKEHNLALHAAGPARGAGTRRTRVWSGVQVRYELSERFLRNASDVRRQAGCRNE
jgi:hypothetical protein